MIPLMVKSGADDPSSATVNVRFAANAIGATWLLHLFQCPHQSL
jgi:hypothetical protein